MREYFNRGGLFRAAKRQTLTKEFSRLSFGLNNFLE